jgi:lipoprotein-anchoring transpeptidase ErfK/SrfK
VTGRGAAGAAACLLGLALGGCGADSEPQDGARPAPLAAPPATTTLPSTAEPAPARRALRPPLAFQLKRRAQLRSRPSGRVLRTLTTKTEFRSPRILAVTKRRDGWVAIRTEKLGNGKVGWVRESSGRLFSQPRTIEIDLSRRRLTVRHRGKVEQRIKVAVGAPGTQTPTGWFAVTDRLHTGGAAGPYGCCILPLTARQPNIAQGWGGGDRIAIHGTTKTAVLGKAVSHGCVRVGNRQMRRLMRGVRLGTPVRIKA